MVCSSNEKNKSYANSRKKLWVFAMRISSSVPLRIFTPSFADADNTNAQNLTVKEIVSRLPEELFRVTMFCIGDPDPRIAARRNTHLLRYRKHGNTPRLLSQCLLSNPHIYFFPRCGPLDRLFFEIKKRLPLRTALVSYIVYMMDKSTGTGLTGRSIVEADCVLGNSRFVSSTILQTFGRDAKTIHDGVDTRYFFSEQKAQRENLVVLYAGSFQTRKRVDLVICQADRFPNVEFRLAGRGETENLCRELVRRYGCKNVQFLGHLSQESLAKEMRNADVFLFPSVQEGHPQVLIQAAASGLPCVAMTAYQPDYVIDGETGFLANSDSELNEKFDVLLKDASLRHSMSVAAARHSKAFQWERIAEQWADIFQETAEYASCC